MHHSSTRLLIIAALAAVPLALTGCSAPAPVVTPTPAPSSAAPIDSTKPEETVDPSQAAPAGFTLLFDDTGVVSVNSPTAWTDISTGSIPGPKGTTILNLAASPDLDKMTHAFDVPGYSISATQDPSLTIDDFMNSLIDSTASYCEDGETGDYDDTVYVGKYLYLPNCDKTTTDFLAVVAKSTDGTLVAVTIQMVTDEDKTTTRDEILNSFYAIFPQ